MKKSEFLKNEIILPINHQIYVYESCNHDTEHYNYYHLNKGYYPYNPNDKTITLDGKTIHIDHICTYCKYVVSVDKFCVTENEIHQEYKKLGSLEYYYIDMWGKLILKTKTNCDDLYRYKELICNKSHLCFKKGEIYKSINDFMFNDNITNCMPVNDIVSYDFFDYFNSQNADKLTLMDLEELINEFTELKQDIKTFTFTQNELEKELQTIKNQLETKTNRFNELTKMKFTKN